MAAIAEAALGYFLIVNVFEPFTLSPRTSEERRSVLHDLKDLLAFKDTLETCFHALFPYEGGFVEGTTDANSIHKHG
ncbi:MAG: hypothetical protein ACI97A_001690 [Planctomycetota bacterium]|jgi:hypothetical protein